uniref:ABC transporter domain-containing protein n=1 Tax=Phaeocystis antarctica TaxID=33657 RepID=A0A7S0EGY2_9EUKA
MLALALAAPALLLPVSRPHGSAAALAAQQQLALPSPRSAAPLMMGKKSGKPKGDNKFKPGGKKGQGQQEKKSVKDNRAAESSKSFIYTILGLTKKLPDGTRTLIKNINLCFFPGAKIGLVGLNGAGKSTLLKLMLQEILPCEGDVRVNPHLRIGRYNQHSEDVLDLTKNPLDFMDGLYPDGIVTTSGKKKMDITDWRAQLGIYGISGNRQTLPMLTMSPGFRARVVFCMMSLRNPQMLLLDEPTNHLDAQSVAWLQSYLEGFKGTVVAITHDRYFLEKSCGWILELERGEGKPFEGNYGMWLEQKAETARVERKSDTRLQKTLENELEWMKSNAKAKQTKSKARLARYEEMLLAPQREELSHTASIYIPPGPRLGQQVVEAKGVRKGFGDRTLIEDLTFSLPPGGIVGIVGPNGAGKTTLIRMLMGEQQPDEGELIIGESVNMICVDQSREGLTGDKSVFEELSGGFETLALGTAEVNSRAYCSWFGFSGQAQQKKLDKLSGGERNRVQLAKVLKSGGNVLLLDEPTNDLDVNTMRSLEEALLEFAGCVVVVSHDRFFLDRIATHILAAEGDAKWVWFEGNYQEYEEDYLKRNGDVAWKPVKYAANTLVST